MRFLFLLIGLALLAWTGCINAGWVTWGNPGLLFPWGVGFGLLGVYPWPEDVDYRTFYRR